MSALLVSVVLGGAVLWEVSEVAQKRQLHLPGPALESSGGLFWQLRATSAYVKIKSAKRS